MEPLVSKHLRTAHSRPAQVRQASAKYAERRQREGWRRIAVWVPEADVERVKKFAAQCGESSGREEQK